MGNQWQSRSKTHTSIPAAPVSKGVSWRRPFPEQSTHVQPKSDDKANEQAYRRRPPSNAMSRLDSSLDLPRAMKPIQTKLTVGAPGDKYEQEADRVADQVMSMGDPKATSEPIAQPIAHPTLSLQAKGDGTEASQEIESQLSQNKGGGSPLPNEVRSFMEPRFGSSFENVRVHTDGNAVQMNRSLGAQAFTHGSDIYYGAGKSPANSDLTAHELTHVVQQTGSVQAKESAEQSVQMKCSACETEEVGVQRSLDVSVVPELVQRSQVCDENGACQMEEGPEASYYKPSENQSQASDVDTSNADQQNDVGAGAPADQAPIDVSTPSNADMSTPEGAEVHGNAPDSEEGGMSSYNSGCYKKSVKDAVRAEVNTVTDYDTAKQAYDNAKKQLVVGCPAALLAGGAAAAAPQNPLPGKVAAGVGAIAACAALNGRVNDAKSAVDAAMQKNNQAREATQDAMNEAGCNKLPP